MEKLKNKIALITGGTSGMGLATAEEFIREGAQVIITGRYENTVREAVEKLGHNARGFASDSGKMTDVLQLRANIKPFTAGIDILYINAGYGRFAAIEDVTEPGFDELFNLLVKGTFFTVQQVLPLMNDGGSIILNTSVVTEYGIPNFSVYSAAKAAVQSFVKTFAMECTPRNIRVNAVSPGYIKTSIFEKTGLSQEQIDGAVASITPTLPYKRFGRPEEIAKTVSFLASADASYIHGTEIIVDGGYLQLK